MSRIGVYFTYWERQWQADLAFYIRKAKALGFDILEASVVNLLPMSDEQLKQVRQVARDEGMELIFGLGFPADKDVSSLDPAVRKAGVEFAKETLRRVAAAGATLFGGITYASWQTLPKETDFHIEPYWDASLTSVREICAAANDLGITYLLESVNRFEGYLINTAEDGVRYLNDLGCANAGLLLDTFHMNVEEDSFADAIHTAGSWLKHFHIGETNRKAPGKGRIPWAEVTKALGDIHYGGPIVMEPFLKTGGSVGQDIKMWHDLSHGASEEELDRDIQGSLQMMRSLMTLNACC